MFVWFIGDKNLFFVEDAVKKWASLLGTPFG